MGLSLTPFFLQMNFADNSENTLESYTCLKAFYKWQLTLIYHWLKRMPFPHEMKLLQYTDSKRPFGLWCYMLSFMVICQSFACLCDSFPGKCVSFLHMLHVITEDLLPKWINSLSSRWLMKSCKFFSSPMNRNRCFTSCGIKTLVKTISSKHWTI